MIILPNGLRVVTVDTGGTQSATVMLLVKAGSRYENSNNNGIAHFFEHMAFKGSAKYPDSFTISSTIEGMGGVFNAFTAKDHTGYWIKGTVDKIGTILDVLADMVTTARLESVEIEKEKGVIIEEINMYEDMPQHKVSNVYDELLYPQHPLGMDIAGTRETVRASTRQTFIDYIGRLYHPDNAVLVIAGGIGSLKESLLKDVERTFGIWRHGIADQTKYDHLLYRTSPAKTPLALFTKATEQAHIVVGYMTDYGFGDTRKYALGVLAGILGGGMSSRLFTEVREKRGLCYYVHTSRDLYAEVGSLATAAGIRNDAQIVNDTLSLIIAEHNKLARTIATDTTLIQETDRVKAMLKGRLLLSLEDSQAVANYYGTKLLLEGVITEPDQTVERIEAVTVKDVLAEAEGLVSEQRLRIALVGPFKSGDIAY